ncbi:hypothetical protein D3C72_2533050 [compost metagenome]
MAVVQHQGLSPARDRRPGARDTVPRDPGRRPLRQHQRLVPDVLGRVDLGIDPHGAFQPSAIAARKALRLHPRRP